MSWLPRLMLQRWTTATDRYEGEGWCLILEWCGFVVEFAIARKEREFPEEPADAS